MLKQKLLAGVFAAALFAATGVQAQTVATDRDIDTTAGIDSTGGESKEPGAFERMSPGNQKIATALFMGQASDTSNSADGSTEGTDSGETAGWTLDDIAMAKQDGQGWGEIFEEMKADGVIDAKNLGQLVSRNHRNSKGNFGGKNKDTYGDDNYTDMDDGNHDMSSGDDPDSGSDDRKHDVASDDNERHAGSDDDDQEVASNNQDGAGAGEDGGNSREASSGDDSTSAGVGSDAGDEEIAKSSAFAELSPGNKKIAEALHDAQANYAGGEAAGWRLDEIAGAKRDGHGWGKIFRDMKSDGLIAEKNLGQVISRSSRAETSVGSTATSRADAKGAATDGHRRAASHKDGDKPKSRPKAGNGSKAEVARAAKSRKNFRGGRKTKSAANGSGNKHAKFSSARKIGRVKTSRTGSNRRPITVATAGASRGGVTASHGSKNTRSSTTVNMTTASGRAATTAASGAASRAASNSGRSTRISRGSNGRGGGHGKRAK